MFELDVEVPAGVNSNPDRKKVDWDARAKYLVDTIDAKDAPEAKIGIISGIVNLGIHKQDDAAAEFKGDAAEEAKILAEETAKTGNPPKQYFQTMPNDKGVDTRYKRWPVPDCQAVSLFIDFPDKMLNQSQFFDDVDTGEHLPHRMLLNGEFFLKGVGKVVGRPYNLQEKPNSSNGWSLKNNTQLFKLAQATGCLDEQGHFKARDVGKLLGKAAMFEIQVFMKKGSDGKDYLQEKIKLNGSIPKVMVPLIPELDKKHLFGVNIRGKQDPEIMKNLRVSVTNTMKQAVNYPNSDFQKAFEPDYKAPEVGETVEVVKHVPHTATAQKAAQAAAPAPEPKEPVDFDDFDSDLPF